MPMLKDYKATFIVGCAQWKIVIKPTYIAINKVKNGIPLFIKFKYIDYPTYTQEGNEGIFNNTFLEYMHVSAYENTNHGRIEIHTTENSDYEFEIPYVVAKALQTLGSGSKNIEGASFTFCKKSCDCNIIVQDRPITIENLLEEIKNLEKANFIEKRYLSYDYNGCNCIKEQLTKIIIMANTLLIDEGRNNWDAMEILQQHNYYVYPGEQDRFGWLTGCIDTAKGTIIFG